MERLSSSTTATARCEKQQALLIVRKQSIETIATIPHRSNTILFRILKHRRDAQLQTNERARSAMRKMITKTQTKAICAWLSDAARTKPRHNLATPPLSSSSAKYYSINPSFIRSFIIPAINGLFDKSNARIVLLCFKNTSLLFCFRNLCFEQTYIKWAIEANRSQIATYIYVCDFLNCQHLKNLVHVRCLSILSCLTNKQKWIS